MHGKRSACSMQFSPHRVRAVFVFGEYPRRAGVMMRGTVTVYPCGRQCTCTELFKRVSLLSSAKALHSIPPPRL